MKTFLLALLLLTGSVLHAQTINVQVGASTLFNAEGGSITLYTANTNETIGLGVSNGRIVAGANSEFISRGWDITAGDKNVFLATQQLGLSTTLRGLQAQHKTANSTLTVFSGLVGDAYSTPFFSGAEAHAFGTGFQFTRKFHNADLSSVVAYTNGKPTILQGAVWHWRGLELQSTGGLLERRAYVIGSASWRLNHAAFDAGRQTLIWQGERSTVSSGSASTWFGPVDAHATAYSSSLAAGQTVGAGLHVGPVIVRGDAFLAKQRSLSSSLTVRFSRRWSLSQFTTRSNGQTAVNFGGSYTSNLVTASVGYQQQFIPFSNIPFQKVLSVTLAFQLPHGTTVNLATVAAPTGGTRWSAYGGSYVQAPWLPATQHAGAQAHAKIGGYELRGVVKDQFGVAVAGAAIVIGKETIYTDLQGEFIARVKKNAAVDLLVDVDSFTAPGSWALVSSPTCASPGDPIQIVVRRK